MAHETAEPPTGPSSSEQPDGQARLATDPAEADQPTAEAGQPPATAEAPAEQGKHRKLLYVTLPGCWGAIIFAALSFTP